MNGFSWSERRFIADVATSVKWAIEQDVEAGVPFEQAKQERIKRAEASWKFLPIDIRQAVYVVCSSIAPSDLSKRTQEAMKDAGLREIEKARGKPLGWVDRLLWRGFGVVWRV